MKQVEVTILGQSYILGCPDGGESSLLEAVADVDRYYEETDAGTRIFIRQLIEMHATNLSVESESMPAVPAHTATNAAKKSGLEMSLASWWV